MGAVVIIIKYSIAILFFVLMPGACFAADFSLGGFYAKGSQMWRTSFPLNGASELYYPHSAKYTTLILEKNLNNQKKFRIEGGFAGALKTARGSDSDWDYTQSNDYWYYGEFKTNGKSNFINIDIIKKIAKTTDFFWGYSYSNNHYQMTDGHYLIDNYTSVNTSLPALASTYTMVYHGPRLGITSKNPISPTLSLINSVAYSPLAIVQGQGWWNLRNMHFSHIGTAQIVDASIGAEFLRQSQTLTIGYRYKYASLYSGSENISSAVSWDKAVFTAHGPFITAKIRF